MIDINKEYIQRSRLFIYPMLYIPATCLVNPINTYIAWTKNNKKIIEPSERKIICVYKDIITDEQKEDEKTHLLQNRYLQNVSVLKNKMIIYVFSIQRINYLWEWDAFMKGEYSKFSAIGKKTITNFYKDHPYEKYVDTYLYPEEYYRKYAELLDVPVEILAENVELLSKPDLTKETLIT